MSSTNVSSLSSTLLTVQLQLTRYVYSMYLIFGVTGGCLNILLLSRKNFRIMSCCTYFRVASIMMLFNLSLGAGSILYTLNHANPNTTIVAFCKCRLYFLQSSAMVYRWCLVMACFDRYLLSSTSARLRCFSQVHVAHRAVILIIIISFLSSVYVLVFNDIKSDICGIVYVAVASIYHSIFTIGVGSLLPVSLMIICALFLYRNLVLKHQRRQQNTNEQTERKKENESQRKRDQQVLMMLLVQSVVFVVLTTPLLIYNFYAAAPIFVTNKTPDRLAIERFVGFLAEMMMLLFTVCSFYLYTLVSRTFRDELVKVFRFVPICNRFINTASIEPVTIDTRSIMTMKQMFYTTNRGIVTVS